MHLLNSIMKMKQKRPWKNFKIKIWAGSKLLLNGVKNHLDIALLKPEDHHSAFYLLKYRKDLSEVKCFSCNKYGHYAKNCPESRYEYVPYMEEYFSSILLKAHNNNIEVQKDPNPHDDAVVVVATVDIAIVGMVVIEVIQDQIADQEVLLEEGIY